MAELKTKRNRASVAKFLESIENDERRADSLALEQIMREITGAKSEMWGPSIVGFGKSSFGRAGGKTTEWFQVGFSPRKQSLVLYIMSDFSHHAALMKKLGKHSTGKSCLYIKRLSDVDRSVLEQLIQASVDRLASSS